MPLHDWSVRFTALSACRSGAGKSLGQTVNEYFCAFQFNSLGFQTAIANHAIATLSQQWRTEGSRLIILMPLYPKIVSQAVLARRRVAVTGEVREAYGAATSFLRSLRLPDEVDEAAGGTAFATNYTHFRAEDAGRRAMRGTCLPGHWLKSYAMAVAVASLAWLGGPEEARGYHSV